MEKKEVTDQPYFLATTALEEFWDTSKPMLFLGSGCLRYSRKHIWETVNGKVLESPWSVRSKFHEAAHYSDEVYEKLLPLIAEKMNDIHNTNHSERYWRILLGHWLLIFVSTIYDRYVTLKNVFNQYPDIITIGLSGDSYVIPRDAIEFINFVCDDPYNLQLTTIILTFLGKKISSKSRKMNNSKKVTSIKHFLAKDTFKNRIKDIYKIINKNNYKFNKNPVVLDNPYFYGSTTELSIFLRTRGYVIGDLDIGNILPHYSIDWKSREKLKNINMGNSEFMNLLPHMLSFTLPQCYLEGYSEIKRNIKNYPPEPKAIFSATSWYFNEAFKHWAGDCSERGTILCGMQHGGCYGSFLYHLNENHEIAITDRFYTWGWEKLNFPQKVVPFYANKLVNRKKIKSFHDSREILFLGTAFTRFLIQFRISEYINVNEYVAWQIRFVDSLKGELRKKLRARLFYNDFGWDIQQQWRDKVADVRIESWDVKFHKSIQNCQLVICDHLSTTYLEALALNKPIVIFWDPTLNELRPEAQVLHDELREAGILYDSPENAAEAVNNIYGNIQEWWCDPKRQTVVKKFCYSFARTSPKALDCWIKEFQRI